MDTITESAHATGAVKAALENHLVVMYQVYREMDFLIRNIADVLIATFTYGGKVYVIGNGGSAADAQHFAAEMIGKFREKKRPLPVEALTTNTSILTALANDFGPDELFERWVGVLGKQDDVLIAISTSGNSANILRAAEIAGNKGMYVIGLTGRSGGKLAKLCNTVLRVPSDDTPRIQEAHMTILHVICELLEDWR